MSAESTGKLLATRASEISRGIGLKKLPKPEDLAEMSAAERHEVQEGLRVELFALSSHLADVAVTRGRRLRAEFPPYGLVHSRHTEMRMVVANPEPVQAGEIDGFLALGKAYLDTTVWHLHGAFAEQRELGRGWLIDRLDDMLKLFKVGASATSRARMRDGVSFIYGGLHFGTSVSVQLVEVMAAMLAETDLSPEEKAGVMARSSKPAYDLANYSVSGVIKVYGGLQSSTRRTVVGKSAQGWLDPDQFVFRGVEGRPWRIDLKEVEEPTEVEEPGELHSYTTLGCPARISPSGATSPIATLWSWCVELAHDTGLLGEWAGMPASAPVAQPAAVADEEAAPVQPAPAPAPEAAPAPRPEDAPTEPPPLPADAAAPRGEYLRPGRRRRS